MNNHKDNPNTCVLPSAVFEPRSYRGPIQELVQGRLVKDDFILDDGVGGYVDNGMDDWGNGDDDAQDDSGDEIIRKADSSRLDMAATERY
jgi:hypothetical protein